MASMYSFLISFPMTYHSMYESTNISNNTLVTKGIEAFNNFLTMRCRIQFHVAQEFRHVANSPNSPH